MFLKPNEMNQIGRDLKQFTQGLDASRVILHWIEVSGAQNSYGRFEIETPMTLEVRAAVVPEDDPRPVQGQAKHDQQAGTHTIYFAPDVDLAGKRDLWIEVPGLGAFRPESEQPNPGERHGGIFPNNTAMVQAVRCRPKL